MKVLAINVDGKLTYCTAAPEDRGKGRCNHIFHQKDFESDECFIQRLSLRESRLQISKTTNTPVCNRDDSGEIVIEDNFGLKNSTGVQLKGNILLVEDNKAENKFLKIDELNPAKGLHYVSNTYDVLYPSLSEDICSRLISSSDIGLNSVLYEFNNINLNGKEYTGSISDNFLSTTDSVEFILTEPNVDSYDIKHDEFVEKVIDSGDNEKILDSLNDFFKRRAQDDTKDFKDYILRQAAFDLMTGNKDRKENSTNFSMINNREGTKIINFDYGRCVQSIWSEKTESCKLSDDEIKELADDMAFDSIKRSSIFSPFLKTDLKNSVDFILNNGFEPFRINMKEFDNKASQLVEKTKGTKFEYYTKFKINLLKSMMNNPEIRRLWREE